MSEHEAALPDPATDRILQRAFAEGAGRLLVPDPALSWGNVRRALEAGRRLERRRRLWTASGLAAAALLVALVASPPSARSWNPWQLISRFFAGQDDWGMVQLSSRKNVEPGVPAPPDDPPGYREVPPEALGVLRSPAPRERSASQRPTVQELKMPPRETITLEEAARRAPFTLRFPAWLPERTAVLRVIYQPPASERGAAEVQIYLGGPLGRDLHLSQNGPIEQFSSGMGFDRDNTRVRQVEIDGTTGILLDFSHDGSSSLQWFARGIHYRIRSDWSGDTTLKIARSLQAVQP